MIVHPQCCRWTLLTGVVSQTINAYQYWKKSVIPSVAPCGAAVRPDTDCLSGDLFTSHDEEESIKLHSSQRAFYLAKLFGVQSSVSWMLGHGVVFHHSWEISGLSPVTANSRLFIIMQQCNTKPSSASLLYFQMCTLLCPSPVWALGSLLPEMWISCPPCAIPVLLSPWRNTGQQNITAIHTSSLQRTAASASYRVSAGKTVTYSHFHFKVLLSLLCSAQYL